MNVPLLVGVLLACFLVGAVPALVHAVKPRLQQLLQLDHDRVDRLERMQFFLAWVLGMPLAGYLVDTWKPHDVLVAGSLGIAFALAFIGVSESARWLGPASFLLGFATSFLVVATLCLVPAAVPASCAAGAMNAGFIAIGIGSFSPKFVLDRLERWLGLRRSLLVLGLTAVIPSFLVFAAFTGQSSTEPDVVPSGASLSLLHDPRFWLLAVMLLFYYPIESALDIWAEPFLEEIGYRDRPGRMLLLGFWTSFLLSRLAMWYLLGPRDEIWLLWFCALTSAIVLGNLVGAYGASSGGVGFWLVGACYGPLLPGFLGLLFELSSSKGLALGSVMALAGLHDALADPVLRRVTRTRPVRVAMRIPLLMTLLMLAPLLVLGLVKWPAP